MKKLLVFAATATTAVLYVTGCSISSKEEHVHHHHEDTKHAQTWSAIREAIAVVHPTTSNLCHGTVRFSQLPQQVKVVANVEGLTPNQKHAIHVHEFGDCNSPDGASAGGHYNPEGHSHGLPDQAHRHAGDLGNLQADAQGKAHYEITVTNLSIAGMVNPIIGRAVIIHAKVDDGGQPTGNAGGRIGCGTIGIVKPSAN